MTRRIQKRNKLGQFRKAFLWEDLVFMKKAKQMSLKLLTLTLMIGISSVSFFGVGRTLAFYNDTESSAGNSFSAAFLDFILTNDTLDKLIGPEALGEISHASVIMPVDGSLPMQYDVSTSIDTTTSNNDFCTGLTVEAKLNGITKYNGPLPGLASATTTTFGTWEFRFDLPPNVSVPNGVECNASVLFSAWRADIANKIDSSWYDEEILNISLTSRMVVLNEIYARPNSVTAPKDREYIELYNNSNAPVDTLGWQISEITGTTETFYPVVASGAVSGEVMPYNGASTIIPVGGFLVLEFGGSASHLDDTGDTVKLYNDVTTLLDSHTYPGISAGKAVVRFPDGIGFWVDPEATPGAENMISMEDLRLAGFDDAMIAEVLKLAELKDITLLSDTKVVEEVAPVIEVIEEAVVETPLVIVPEITPETIPEVIIDIPPIVEPVVKEVMAEEPVVVEEPTKPEEVVEIKAEEPQPETIASALELIPEPTEAVESITPNE